MTNKEKFLALTSKNTSKTLEKNNWRIKNRQWLNESQDIAFKVLERIDELNWTQVDLAKKLEVSPQQINKIVKGQENLTLSTLKKLQEILDIPLMASYYENKTSEISKDLIVVVEEALQSYIASELKSTLYQSSSLIKISHNNYTNMYSHQKIG